MYYIQHTPFRPQVKLYMLYNEYYVKKKKKTFYRKRNCVMEQYKPDVQHRRGGRALPV